MMSKNIRDYELLSAYIDGELSAEEIAQLEERIKSSLDLRNKLEELRRTKQLVSSSIKKIPESPYFETRLFAELKSQRSLGNSLLRWSPAIGLVVLTMVLMVFLKFNPEAFENLIEQQKTNLAGFYKENLQPLLFAADLNNEDIFNFAMYKQLPLDKKNKQMLHIGNGADGKEFFEIKYDEGQSENNFEKFIISLNLNELQKDQIDSILKRYADELEGQVLVNGNNTIAINSNIWYYQRAIQTDLMAFAETSNRNEFSKFVPRSVSFTVNPRVRQVANDLRTTKNKNYIILTPDSIFSEELEFNSDEFRKRMKEMESELSDRNKEFNRQSERIKEISLHIRYDSSWKKLRDQYDLQKEFHVFLDTNLCRVEIPEFHMSDIKIPDLDSLFSSFDSVANNFRFYSKYIPRIEFFNDKMKFNFDDDSVKSYEFNYRNFNLDSLSEAHKEFFDSLRNFNWNNIFRFNDSLAMKNFPDFDGNFDFFNDNKDIEIQMNELKEELKKFREEMKMWREEFKENSKQGEEKDISE